MKLKEIRDAYDNGELTKIDYFKRMQQEHSRLADYASFLKNTGIASIEIAEDSVVFTARNSGVKIACDPNDKGIPPIVALNLGEYEQEYGAMIFKLVEGAGTFFDVGANLGWYGLHVARMFPQTKVFGFEPISQTFQYLQRNVLINQLTNMQVFPFGLSSENEDRTFYVDPFIMGAASSAPSAAGSGEAQLCRVRTLDEVVSELTVSVESLKMDVEGAELSVIRGGIKSIRQGKPVIFSEMLRKHAATFRYHPNDIIELLAKEGYRCFTCRGDRLFEFPSMDEKTVDTNFIFLHSDKHKTKIDQFAE